jgi:integrase
MGIVLGIKNQKGTVSVENFKNRIRLRWRYHGKRYSLALSAFNKVNLHAAKKVVLQIELDISKDQFDYSLVKYGGKANDRGDSGSNIQETFVAKFEYWVKNYKQMDCEIHTNYNSTRNMIKKWGRVESGNLLKKLNAETNAPVTYNRRLTILRTFIDWLVEQQVWETNPLSSVQRKRIKTKKLSTREPFTTEEISRILEAFRTNSACSTYSNTKHDFYYPFIYFLFKTGVRNAEAIGLRIKHLDFGSNQISIREVLARTLKSTGANNRVRKSTKNEKERILPLTPDLASVLRPLVENRAPDDLVFLSPQKKSMDDENFRKRVFYLVLDFLGIRRRVIYACRHGFASRCIESGFTPVMTAFLMGNNPETTLKRYTHQLNIPDNLPSI